MYNMFIAYFGLVMLSLCADQAYVYCSNLLDITLYTIGYMLYSFISCVVL